mgnify:CR=1 FL=1
MSFFYAQKTPKRGKHSRDQGIVSLEPILRAGIQKYFSLVFWFKWKFEDLLLRLTNLQCVVILFAFRTWYIYLGLMEKCLWFIYRTALLCPSSSESNSFGWARRPFGLPSRRRPSARHSLAPKRGRYQFEQSENCPR